MRPVRHPARERARARAARLGCALALVAVALAWPGVERAAAQEGGVTSGGAMSDWASDVATEAVSGRGREPVEASRVSLDVDGGTVVVQWSLSYDVDTVAERGPGPSNRFPVAQVQAIAALERSGVEIARWTLGEDRVQAGQDGLAQARLTGTASGLFIDRAPGHGRKTYVLKVSNEGARRYGAVTLGTRAMICEKR
jgi:hypothetical protein